jgi:predicted transcriptional regulator
MEKERVRRLLVVDGDEEIVGVLTVEDIAARGDPKLAGKILERTATAS